MVGSVKSFRNFYEEFHKDSKLQKRIISRKNFTYRDITEIIEKYKGYCCGKKALDIGCGSGTLSFFLASIGFAVTSIDISKRAIDICKKNKEILGLAKKINFIRIDFPSGKIMGKYDLIVCSEVLEHIANDKLALKVIEEKLTDKGVVIFSVPSTGCPFYKLGLSNKHDKEVGHLRRYNTLILDNMLRESGLKPLEIIKTEGALKNFLFIVKSPVNGLIIKLSNRFQLMADTIFLIDKVFLRLFGNSQIILVAQKYENRN